MGKVKKVKKKTHKATAKRFKIRASAKKKGNLSSITHGQQGDNAHLRSKKTRDRKARLSKTKSLGSKNQAKKIISLVA